ncbi:MAG: hypothetical protein CMJ70_22665 [Planctomycetaceae bacterium]|nr:hypothetical protein [Planctomycetaceae bacterium]HAA69169.1 hypothetical protein [Planctomycetaceae bacterium]
MWGLGLWGLGNRPRGANQEDNCDTAAPVRFFAQGRSVLFQGNEKTESYHNTGPCRVSRIWAACCCCWLVIEAVAVVVALSHRW